MRRKQKCPKCGTNMHKLGYSFVGGGGGLDPIFTLETMGCRRCGYSEWTIIDFWEDEAE